VLFFHSLLTKHRSIMRSCDVIQGTTYTPLAFLPFPIPVISHFGSTTRGFLDAVPRSIHIKEPRAKKVWYQLRKDKVIKELNLRTHRPLRDVADIEAYVATRADGVIATSKMVKDELLAMGVPEDNVRLVHNAIEDYWFAPAAPGVDTLPPGIAFLGRLGSDPFTLKLKGFDRICDLFLRFPDVPKGLIAMTTNERLVEWMTEHIPNLSLHINVQKERIPQQLDRWKGSVLFVSSRYEGFSLSLIEGMSRGLIPVTYPVGVAPELIENGKNGYLVNSVDEARAVIKDILADNALRLRLSAAAQKSAQPFVASRMAAQMRDFYEEVVAKTRKSGIVPRRKKRAAGKK
jgi:glycosyltransferase involved in cell wall biosynthesis